MTIPPAPARSLVVVTAGLGVPSSTRLLADRLAAATERHLRDGGLEPAIAVVELREHAQDLVSHLLTGFPSPKLQGAIDAVLAADGLIAVTPIFSASYSGLFKLFFDVIDRSGLAGTPTLLGATGGTPRHSLAIEHAMRPLFAYLGAATTRPGVYAAADSWGAAGVPAEGGLAARTDLAPTELAAAIRARPPVRIENRFSDPVPFEDLLASGRAED